ncbi:hypothetical protein OYT88_04750 [Sporolactobacillus sp. CQH2019]|nr:hypothetical protein [Sporolactobacillus sp. CQH2019]MDD9147857.1 hypothetical protein [Sporolactobacillus sp. CQH2019]
MTKQEQELCNELAKQATERLKRGNEAEDVLNLVKAIAILKQN